MESLGVVVRQAVRVRSLSWPALFGWVVLAILLLLPSLSPSNFILQVFFVIFYLAALGQTWNILGGYCGYYSLGHTIFLGMGGYTFAILTLKLGLSPIIGVPAGGLMAMLTGLGIGLICFRIRGPYFLIVTLSITFVLHSLAVNLPQISGGNVGLSLPLLPLTPQAERTLFYYLAMFVMLVTALAARQISRSTLGLEFRAIRDDEDVAESMGVNTSRVKLIAVAISSFFAGFAGAVYIWQAHFVDPDTAFNVMMSVYAILVPALGGAGTVIGPMIGAAVIATASTGLALAIPSVLNAVLFGLFLVAIVLFMPEGILGVWRDWRRKTRKG